MTYPDGGDMLEGLDPTQEERLAFLEVLDEVEAEEAGVDLDAPPGLGDDDGDGYGPWRDQVAQYGAAGEQLGANYATDAQRAAEDAEDAAALKHRPSAEDKLIRGLHRIESGTYTESPYFRPARDARGLYAPGACGELDETGTYCASRYHEPGCSAVIAQAAATGSATEAEAWNATLSGYTSSADVAEAASRVTGLASPGDGGFDSWEDLLRPDNGADPALHARMLQQLGELDGPETLPAREPLPDVTVLRAELGL